MIGIINCNTNNLQSLINTFNLIDEETILINDIKDFDKAHSLILPGVGSFQSGMSNLNKNGFAEKIILDVLQKGKPILGICLGMQLFATIGYEYGKHQGLNLFESEVIRFENNNNSDFKIPHIGWNDIELINNNYIFNGIANFSDFYFVHSYHFVPASKKIITSKCDYYGKFVSTFQNENIYGAQFHPEKSQVNGIKFLKNWIQMVEHA